MTTPISIESLDIQGFRAYLSPQHFPMRRGKAPLSIAIFAPNAKGKSSLIDSFEYYFSEDATLARLGKRAAQRHAGPQALEHVDAEISGIEPEVKFRFRHGPETFGGTRSVKNGSDIPEAAKRVKSGTTVPFVIRGYELRSFVENTTPDQRYKELAGWLALDPLLTIQMSLRALRRNVKCRTESNSELNERLRDLRRVTGDAVDEWDEAKVCSWFNDDILSNLDNSLNLTEVSTQDDTYRALVDLKSAEDERIGLLGLRALVAQVTNVFYSTESGNETESVRIVEFDVAVSNLAQATSREQDERAKAAQSVFSDIWAQAEDLLSNKAPDLDVCPICDTAFSSTPHGSREAVHLKLIEGLSGLEAFQLARTELQEAQEQVSRAVDTLKTEISGLMVNAKNMRYEFDATALSDYVKQLDTWKPSSPAPDSRTVVRTIRSLHASLVEAIKRLLMQQGEYTYSDALEKANELLNIKGELNRIHRTKIALRALDEQLHSQAQYIDKSIKAHTGRLIRNLQGEVDTIYRKLQGSEENTPPIRFLLADEDEANQQTIRLVIDFADNRKDVIPSGYLSDSQIHTLALALRLVAVRTFNQPAPILALDDIVTSYDADHRKNIAEVLAEEFSDLQIVLVTHDEQFFCLLKDHLPPAGWAFKRITHVDDDYGPVFADHLTTDEHIESKLDLGRSAGADIRQAEEEWLLRICRDFCVSVPIRPVEKAFQYDRSELADGLARFLNNAKITPPTVKGISNPFLQSLQRGAVENLASHFSDNPYKTTSTGDDKARWKEFKFFRDKFLCPTCGKGRFYKVAHQPKPACSSCQTPFAFLPAQ